MFFFQTTTTIIIINNKGLAWGIIIPIATFLPFFTKPWFEKRNSFLIKLHIWLNCFGFILSIIGFGLIISYRENHFDNNHAIIGLVIVILSVSQIVNGFARPSNSANKGDEKVILPY
eukprot:Pgem_evm1s14940